MWAKLLAWNSQMTAATIQWHLCTIVFRTYGSPLWRATTTGMSLVSLCLNLLSRILLLDLFPITTTMTISNIKSNTSSNSKEYSLLLNRIHLISRQMLNSRSKLNKNCHPWCTVSRILKEVALWLKEEDSNTQLRTAPLKATEGGLQAITISMRRVLGKKWSLVCRNAASKWNWKTKPATINATMA